jgi:hypothetical protein
LVKSGIDEKVLLAYINAAATPYQLGADEIAYLADLGVSPEVLRRLGATAEQAGQADAPPVTAETPAAPATEEATASPDMAPTAGVTPAEPVAATLPPAMESAASVQETVVEPPAVAAPPPAAVNISFFYEALAPYGNWIQVDGAQYWQPAAVELDPDWQPYCQRGHWVNSDCGWAWYSDYSWGWAPFHYGRWWHHERHGWIWAPDTVCGPAWVNWREHAGVIGWAPLPPGAVYLPGVGFTFHGRQVAVGFEFGLQAQQYTFVDVRYFCEPGLAQRMLPRTQVAHYYANTTIIQNNYTYINNVIVNRGPSVTLIAEVTHREIPRVRIVDQDLRPGQPIRGNVVNAGQLALYRPRVAPIAPETPRAVVARHNAETAKREEARRTSVFNPAEGGSPAQQESVRGRDSLAAIQSAGVLGNQAVVTRKQAETAAERPPEEQDRSPASQQQPPAPQTEAGHAQAQSSAADRLREEQRAAQASQQQAAERLRHEEAAGRQRAQQEAAAQQEAQRLRTQQEEATRQRVQQEAERLRKQAESAENLRQQKEAERLRQAEAQARKQQQEAAQREREDQLRAQQAAQRQQEEQRQAREAADRLRAEEEAAARVRAQEAADRQRAQQEAAERQREEQRQAQQEAAQREEQRRAQQEEAARATAASERGAASRGSGR